MDNILDSRYDPRKQSKAYSGKEEHDFDVNANKFQKLERAKGSFQELPIVTSDRNTDRPFPSPTRLSNVLY